jgi:hypothetical protein
VSLASYVTRFLLIPPIGYERALGRAREVGIRSADQHGGGSFH